MSREKAITIRGVTYPSKSAAARALSVRKSLVWRAECEGWVENLGLGKQLDRTGRLWTTQMGAYR
jgi:hypothetical protein